MHKTKIAILGIIVILSIYSIILRFSNPSLSETEILLKIFGF